MTEISRRDFIKLITLGGAILGLGGVIFQKPFKAIADGKYDIGQCKSVKIRCISELGWFDNERHIAPIRRAGGDGSNQWNMPWDPENAAGSCSLIDMETIEGTHHKFLFDTGWNHQYMEKAFKREVIDKMLKAGEIEFLFISHEHMDHWWALETVLKYNSEIKIFIPSTFYPEAMHFISGAEFLKSSARNRIPHRGKLVQLEPEIPKNCMQSLHWFTSSPKDGRIRLSNSENSFDIQFLS